jgi:isoquinoline 1-oxidoreductase subunit beta
MEILDLTRRQFLHTGAIVGGGFLVGVFVPGLSRISRVRADEGMFQPNAFIRITPDDRITVFVGMSEMGQGVLTALPQIIAEELEVDWAQVRVEQAPTDPAYANPVFGSQSTGGSSSVTGHWLPLRKAGATAREILISAAAASWQVDRSSCRAVNGAVLHENGDKLSYGQLVARAASVPVPSEVPLKDPADFKIVGVGHRRLDTPQKINGTAQYGLDVRLPGMLTAVVCRAPTVGAKVKSFNADKTLAVAGVKHVLQIGSGVAVVGDGYWLARQGRDALQVQWESGANAPLSSDSIRAAMLQRLEQPGLVARNDGDVAGAQPVRSLDALYETPYLAHACMEPMNCTAWLQPGGLEVWASTQAPGPNRAVLAKLLGIDPKSVRVHTMLLGGGFGRRAVQDFAIDAAEITRAVGAPVKVIYTREDDMRAQYYRPAAAVRISAGLDSSGNPLLLQASVACSSIGQAVGMSKAGEVDPLAVEGLRDWPYETPNVRVEWTQYEAGIGVWFWRSVGNSYNVFFAESFVDELAHAAGKDSYAYRRALLLQQPRHLAVLDLAAEKAGWGQALPPGRARGIAVAKCFGSYVAEVVEVSLKKNHEPRVHRVVCAVDCGRIINPQIVRRQIESAVIFGLSAALHGRITLKDGAIEQGNFDTYPVVRITEAPRIEVHLVSSTEPPTGIGEPGTPPLAPAVANALFVLTGKRLRSLPIQAADLNA